MLGHDLLIGDDGDPLGIQPHADAVPGQGAGHRIAITGDADQAGAGDAGR